MDTSGYLPAYLLGSPAAKSVSNEGEGRGRQGRGQGMEKEREGVSFTACFSQCFVWLVQVMGHLILCHPMKMAIALLMVYIQVLKVAGEEIPIFPTIQYCSALCDAKRKNQILEFPFS